ncbi:hypothetical protein [Streptomyces sp. NPDC094147]|uniref:nSTAND1 domain-containing NTPase n=1 Tax=Streptomyces sp. NPDC094147 TaxID=3366057 RepID=UPI003827DB03
MLIGEARRARPRPVEPGLYDVPHWRALWQQARDTAPAPCPYRGLAAYRAEDAGWFFGQEQDTAALVGELSRCLDGDGLLILLGGSGAGKSSLLRAGLLPALAGGALRGSDKWPVAVLTPTGDPLAALVHATASALGCSPAVLRNAAEAAQSRAVGLAGRRWTSRMAGWAKQPQDHQPVRAAAAAYRPSLRERFSSG